VATATDSNYDIPCLHIQIKRVGIKETKYGPFMDKCVGTPIYSIEINLMTTIVNYYLKLYSFFINRR
jgi:hypothetical protein